MLKVRASPPCSSLVTANLIGNYRVAIDIAFSEAGQTEVRVEDREYNIPCNSSLLELKVCLAYYSSNAS